MITQKIFKENTLEPRTIRRATAVEPAQMEAETFKISGVAQLLQALPRPPGSSLSRRLGADAGRLLRSMTAAWDQVQPPDRERVLRDRLCASANLDLPSRASESHRGRS